MTNCCFFLSYSQTTFTSTWEFFLLQSNSTFTWVQFWATLHTSVCHTDQVIMFPAATAVVWNKQDKNQNEHKQRWPQWLKKEKSSTYRNSHFINKNKSRKKTSQYWTHCLTKTLAERGLKSESFCFSYLWDRGTNCFEQWFMEWVSWVFIYGFLSHPSSPAKRRKWGINLDWQFSLNLTLGQNSTYHLGFLFPLLMRSDQFKFHLNMHLVLIGWDLYNIPYFFFFKAWSMHPGHVAGLVT